MSDRQHTAAAISLEDIFQSSDFGRRPARRDIAAVTTVEPTDALLLEQVFLSDLFGRPEAIAVRDRTRFVVPDPVAARPPLVLLGGRGDGARDLVRYRGAVGAVSGVAAAALVVLGMASGTGQIAGPPTVSATGPHHGHGTTPGGGSSPGSGGVATQPNASSTSTAPPAATPGFEAPVAQFASFTQPATAAAVVAVPPPAPVPVAPPPPAPGGGPTPSGTSPGGGGGVLTPVLVAVGNTVSTVGATVTAASNKIAGALPVAAPVTGLLGTVGATVTSLGRSVAGV